MPETIKMNRSKPRSGIAGTIFALASLFCSFPVLAIYLWLAISGTPQTDEQMATNYLVGFMGSMATIVLSLPALVCGLAGVFLRRNALTWVACMLSLFPMGILVTAVYQNVGELGRMAGRDAPGSHRVKYSYELLGKQRDGSITRIRGGSGSRHIRDGFVAPVPVREPRVRWTVLSASGTHVTFRVHWPDESTKEIDVRLGQQVELWASDGVSGARFTVDEIDDKIAAIENIISESSKRGGDPVYALVKILEKPDVGIARDAARQLERMGKGSAAVPVLVDSLKSENRLTRVLAVDCLVLLRDQARASVPALIEVLDDEDRSLQISAANALGNIGPAAKPSVPRLRELVENQPVRTRNHLQWVIKQIGPVDSAEIPELLEDLRLEEQRLRAAHDARIELRVPKLSALMTDEDVTVRRRASMEAVKLGSRSIGATAALSKGLHDVDTQVRVQSAQALGRIGEGARVAVPTLNEALRDESPEVRAATAHALGMIGVRNDETVAHLETALGDVMPTVRGRAAVAIWKLTEDTSLSIPCLINMLEKEQPSRVKFDAAFGLQELGLQSIAPLIEALKDPSTQGGAQDALVRIGPPAIPQLIDALGSSGRTGGSSVAALVMIGAVAIPELAEALNHKDVEVRVGVARALGHFNRFPEPARDALFNALADEDGLVRRAAANSLGRLGRDQGLVVAALLKVLEDEEPSVRLNAALAIDKLSPDLKSTEPRIAIELNLEERRKRLLFAYGLFREQKLEEAVTAYQEILEDSPCLTAHYGLGRALQSTGRWDEARAEFEGVLRQLKKQGVAGPLQPVSKTEFPAFAITDVYVRLAMVERSSNSEDSERSVWQDFVLMLESDPGPENPRYLGRLAEAYYQLGRYDLAKTVLEKELQILGESEPGARGGLRWWYLTLILARQHETELARDYYEQLKSANAPENVVAFELQTELEKILTGSVEPARESE